jgi:hypothetical protein
MFLLVASVVAMLKYAEAQTPPPPSAKRPFIESSFESLSLASSALSVTCLNQYTEQFRQKFKDELAVVRGQISTLCPSITQSVLTAAYVNMFSAGTDVSMSHAIYVATQGGDSLENLEGCGSQISVFLSDLANWQQPIWTDIASCPSLSFTSSSFAWNKIAWVCPAAAWNES